MDRLPEKETVVNSVKENSKAGDRATHILNYVLIFLVILLLVGLFELKQIKPEQKPFRVEYGEK